VAAAGHGGAAVRWRLVPLLLLAAAGCRGSLSPLSNRLKVGQESYILFVADGEEHLGDIFASAPTGGATYQVTFTRLDERLPSLSPDGAVVAFLRSRAPGERAIGQLVLMNLLNGAERSATLPVDSVSALGWSADGSVVYLQTPTGRLRAAAPPGPFEVLPPEPADSAAADSALGIPLGDPPAGMVASCPADRGICARLSNGDVATLDSAGAGPFHWSGDSIGYEVAGDFVVRPLGGGRTRLIRWSTPPVHPRELTYFPGLARADTSRS